MNLADDRLINGCIYCGGAGETRDHIPSLILMDRPYPDNLPVVDSCKDCNQGFSLDEQYVVCLLESAIAGSTDPKKIRRSSVAKIMQKSPALRARIQAARNVIDGQINFLVEEDRIKNVMLKLAKGHAAFELSQPTSRPPDYFWCGPLLSLDPETKDRFDSMHVQQTFGEIGSRGLQRMFVMEFKLQPTTGGEELSDRILINDWVEVQAGNYRYLAIDDIGGIVIRIVIAEYLACEVAWLTDLKQIPTGKSSNTTNSSAAGE